MQPPSIINVARIPALVQLATEAPYGPIVEVGVYKGGSAWHLATVARAKGVALHLFDTFTGIPHAEAFDTNHVGEFGDTSAEAVQAAIPDARLHIGLFPDTLPDDLTGLGFIHSDCDQYVSVRAVIETLYSRLVPGGVLAFDDMDTAGGARAIREFFDGRLHTRGGYWYVVKPY